MKEIIKYMMKLLYYFQYLLTDLQLKRKVATQQLMIVVGASGVFEDGWIPTDIRNLNIVLDANWQRYFKPDSINAILAEHVWEHLSPEEAAVAASNCYVYLKFGGYLRVAVPDGLHPSPEYIDRVKPGGSGAGADDHKVLYDYNSFSKVFSSAGFKVELLEYFDEHGEFHFIDWDYEVGMIERSYRFDERNSGGSLTYTSIIIDAWKV